MGPQSVCVNTPPGRKRSYFHTPRIKSDAYALAATPDGTIQLPTPPALSMAWHLIPSKHDPHPRQRRETSFALLPYTTRSSLLSCSRRSSTRINCRRAESKNFVPRSAATCRLCRLSPFHPLWHVGNQRLRPRRCLSFPTPLRFAMPLAAEESEKAIGPSTGGKPNPSTRFFVKMSLAAQRVKAWNSLSPELTTTNVCLPTSWSKK